MQYILYILSIPFLYINYKIIKSDLKYKIIPNKYLNYLLLIIPFYYIYTFFSVNEINYWFFLLQISLTILISFILYFFWIWAAWDAKYLLVLSLFIPYLWIIPFIWNIALITVIYLIIYFIQFYLWKCIIKKWYAKELLKQIINDLSEKWRIHKKNKWWSNFFIILKFLIFFFIIFVSLRLSRIYLLKLVLEKNNNWYILENLIENYSIYLLLILMIISLWMIYLSIFTINKTKIYFNTKFKIKKESIWNIFMILLLIFLLTFIFNEYITNKKEITELLIRIFTLYLIIYIVFKMLIYSYKLTFWVAETHHIKIDELKQWDIVDKNFLVKMLWDQSALWNNNENEKWSESILLEPNPVEFFNNLNWPLDEYDLKTIKRCYNIVNEYHKKEDTNWYTELKQIKILKTFPFWIYIISWFIMTFFLDDKIFKYIMNYFFDILKSFY